MEKYLNIGVSVKKVDAVSLAAGEEKFTDDFRTQSPLHTAFLYSPVAHAEIIKVDTSEAEKVPGVADILYYENVPGVLHTTAGQGYPEPSPYDSLLFDRKVRFVGDRVALVAAETRDTALKAIKKIKVEYKELEPLFDFEKAMDKNAPRVHDGDEYAKIPAEYRPEENLAAAIEIGFGDLEKVSLRLTISRIMFTKCITHLTAQ